MPLHQLMVDLAGLKSQLLAQPQERVNGNWPEEMRLQSELMSGRRVECKFPCQSARPAYANHTAVWPSRQRESGRAR